MKDKIAIGKILSTHGIKGFVKVKSLSGETEHFNKLNEIILDKNGKEVILEIEEIKTAHDAVLMKFRGVDTPENAKLYSSQIIWVDRIDACELKKDEYYLKDICQCDVYLKKEIIGKVKSVFEGANTDNLEIVLNNNKTAIVPFMDRFIGEVNIKEKKIFIREDCNII